MKNYLIIKKNIEYKRNANNYHQVSLAYMDKKVYDLMMDRFKLDREKLYKQIDEHIQYIAPYLEAEKNYFDFARANPDDKKSKMNLYSQYKDLETKTQIRGLNSDYESSFQCYYRNTWFDFNNHMTMDNKDRIEFNKAVNKIAQERYNDAFGEDIPKPRNKKLKPWK